MLIFENSLFSGSEQNAYYLETYSEHCQTSKMEYFEKIVESFELSTIFVKSCNLDVWQSSE